MNRDDIQASIESLAVHAVAVPVGLLDGDRVVDANPALCRLVGRELAQLCDGPALAWVEDSAREAVARASAAIAAGGDAPPAMSMDLCTPDGGRRPVEMHLRALDRGDRTLTVLTCLDQSDIQHVQHSLFTVSGQLQQIVDLAPIAMLVVDGEGRVTRWNSACEHLTGIPRQEMLGRREHWRAFYGHERPLLCDLIVQQRSDAEIVAQYGTEVRRTPLLPGGLESEAFFPQLGDGGAWLYFTAAPLLDGSGRLAGAIETLQDVTARRRAQEALMQHRLELERIVEQRTAELAATARDLEMFIENAPIGVAFTVAGVVRRANQAMAGMLGLPLSEVLGLRTADMYLSEADYAALSALAGPVLSRGEPFHHELQLRHASGRALWVQLDGYVADVGNTGRGTWWMIQDRTENVQARAQLQARFEELQATNGKLAEAQNQLLQQDKMASIGQLAAGVAHEINNPIGFVSSNLSTLRQYVEGLLELSARYDAALAAPGDVTKAAELVRKREEVELDYLRDDLPQLLDECDDGLLRVKKIVQDLKDFSRVDQNDWQTADLNAGLESTLNVVRHELKYKAEVVKRLQTLPPVHCLAAQLNQVFMNLIVNAAHAITEKGTITLSSGVDGPWAWVQVDDDGCGMDEEVQRRIFEPFFTTKEVGKGTGLGLSLSFSIVQKHGGAIRLRSAPGQGTGFRVYVPIDGPEAAAGAAPPSWPTGALP